VITALIRWSVRNRILVVLVSAILAAWGTYSALTIPLDALPDLSDVQVIIRTSYPGQAPQTVEDQVTYPLSTAMLSVPGAVTVRGYSFYGDSYVYVIFDDNTDLYWARSRVLEYLSQVTDQLPAGAKPKLGPDATGVGWVYEYALLDRSGKHDLSQLRSIQDWFLKFDLQTVPGVAEVATIGGMVKQYQVVIDPDKLRGYYLTVANVKRAIRDSNSESGGSVLEFAEAEYMVRLRGYLKNLKDIGLISVPTLRRRLSISSVLLDDVAREIRIGPAMRRGLADLNGEGEVVGGVVVMRKGGNALATINAVKARLEVLRKSLPEGVQLVTTYDRSRLIERGVATLSHRLVEEFLVVVLVCFLFLSNWRSSLVILISLPVGIIVAFMAMRLQGINANIMSLGGIAIAIGAMMDAAIVIIENVHKHIEKEAVNGISRLQSIQNAASEVGAPLFFSLLIITLSFLPVFALQAQEARLFNPLAYTKTYAMAVASGLSVTLVPALIAFFITGKVRREDANFLNRGLISAYRPVITWVLRYPKSTLVLAGLLVLMSIVPLQHLGREFMPKMNEGDLLYMPTTLPGISIGKAREVLQKTDRLIRSVPEVQRVFGKVGRAETATDPAPLTMLETTIQLRPKAQWREGMDMQGIIDELDRTVRLPSINNAWLMPIRTRINMQSTGINTPLGIKIAGGDLNQIQSIGTRLEALLARLPGTRSVFADRAVGARYIEVDLDRDALAHFGLSVRQVQEAANIAIGGANLTYTVEGRERYPVNLRYPQEMRNSITKLRELSIVATEDIHIQLQDLADVRVVDGPQMIKSENGQLNAWVYITTDGRDMASYIQAAEQAFRDQLSLPSGYTISWAGQY